VVSTYTLFGTALATGGPPMIWAFLLAGAGQYLVALVFGEIVAQYPIAGGVYPWARRLWGKRWAWMTGRVYMWALLVTVTITITITSVAYGAGPFVAILIGFEPPVHTTVLCTLALIFVAALINYAGTKTLSKAAIIGFTAELVGALIAFGSLIPADALTKIVSFAILGIYASFQMVVLAAPRARLKGWRPSGEFRGVRWGLLVNAAGWPMDSSPSSTSPGRAPRGALVRQLDRAAVRRRGAGDRAAVHVHHAPLRARRRALGRRDHGGGARRARAEAAVTPPH
jgi:amino acid transporter